MNEKNEKVSLDDRIFRFIYIEAMRDAVLQLAYKGEKKWLEEPAVMKAIKEYIEPLIDNVFDNKYSLQEEYDKDFLDITFNICDHINHKANNKNFTFGNAQKLVNIMLKYFYIVSYKNDSLKKNFRFCHCPMDQQLLENIWNNRKKLDANSEFEKRDEFLKSWGNEDFEVNKNGEIAYPKRYMLFQQAVRRAGGDESPIEYDYRQW